MEEMNLCLSFLGRSTQTSNFAIRLAAHAMNTVHPHDDAIRGRQAEPIELAKVLSLASFVETLSCDLSKSFSDTCNYSRAAPDEDAAAMKSIDLENMLRLHRAIAELVDYAAIIGGRSCVPPPPPEIPESTDFGLD